MSTFEEIYAQLSLKQKYKQLKEDAFEIEMAHNSLKKELNDANDEIKTLSADLACFYDAYMKEKEKNALLLKENELLKAPKKQTRVFKTITKKTVFPRRLFKKTN